MLTADGNNSRRKMIEKHLPVIEADVRASIRCARMLVELLRLRKSVADHGVRIGDGVSEFAARVLSGRVRCSARPVLVTRSAHQVEVDADDALLKSLESFEKQVESLVRSATRALADDEDLTPSLVAYVVKCHTSPPDRYDFAAWSLVSSRWATSDPETWRKMEQITSLREWLRTSKAYLNSLYGKLPELPKRMVW